MGSLSAALGSEERIWEGALQGLERRSGIDAEERARWGDLYEHELGRVRHEGVTFADCARVRARVEAWSILRRMLPTRSVPTDPNFALCVRTMAGLAKWRDEGGDKPSASDVERTQRFGRALFDHWWDSIEEHLPRCERAAVKLRHFGTADDAPEIERLWTRGDNLFRWIRYQESSGVLPWLPPYHWHPHPLDAVWRTDARASKHRDVCVWWESTRPAA